MAEPARDDLEQARDDSEPARELITRLITRHVESVLLFYLAPCGPRAT
jgi:hypothetical protein